MLFTFIRKRFINNIFHIEFYSVTNNFKVETNTIYTNKIDNKFHFAFIERIRDTLFEITLGFDAVVYIMRYDITTKDIKPKYEFIKKQYKQDDKKKHLFKTLHIPIHLMVDGYFKERGYNTIEKDKYLLAVDYVMSQKYLLVGQVFTIRPNTVSMVIASQPPQTIKTTHRTNHVLTLDLTSGEIISEQLTEGVIEKPINIDGVLHIKETMAVNIDNSSIFYIDGNEAVFPFIETEKTEDA